MRGAEARHPISPAAPTSGGSWRRDSPFVSEGTDGLARTRACDRHGGPDARRARASDRGAGRRRAAHSARDHARLGRSRRLARHDPRSRGPLRPGRFHPAAQLDARPYAERHRRARRHSRTGRLVPSRHRVHDVGDPRLDDRDRSAAVDPVLGCAPGFFLELALVAAAAAIVLFLIALVLLHGRREAERERSRARQRHELTRILGSASLGSDVSDGLVAGLSDAFPGALCIVALEAAESPRPRALGLLRGRFPGDAGRPRHRRRPGGHAGLRLRHRHRDRQGSGPAVDPTRRAQGAARGRALVLRHAARHAAPAAGSGALPAVRAHAPAE